MRTAIFVILLFLSFSACRHDRRPSSRRQTVKTETPQQQPPSKQQNTQPPSNTDKNTTSVLTGSQIYERCNSAVFYVLTTDGQHQYQGSGFFVTANGRAVSNYHVFQGTLMGGEEIYLTDGRKLKISQVIHKSEKYDFIVFDVKTSKSVNYIPLSTHKNKIGDEIFAIGSPRGLDNTFSQGQISQIRPNEDYQLQINVPIDHGSSGGALINRFGEAIGITSAGLNSTANLNFAVDIERVRGYIK